MTSQATTSDEAAEHGALVEGNDVRTRLIARLEHAVASAPLTVITAPLGYGKTTLVRQWAAVTHRCVVLVELGRDDDLVSFGRSLLDATARAGATEPAVLAEERRAVAAVDQGVAKRLLADLSARGEVVVVVDALDAPSAAGVVDEIGALLSAAAGGLRVVVTRRSRGPAALTQMAWSGAVQLIDRDELALTPDEASTLLHQVTDRVIEADALVELMERTRGWPEAVTLVAAQAAGDRRSGSALDLRTHQAAERLTQAVLSNLSPSITRFLVRSSVLVQMNGPLCDAVTGDRNGGLMLRLLERRGAPIWRTDLPGDWYQSHPLLREGLRQILHRQAELEPRALRAAARWLSAHGRPDEAADYLLEAEDWSGLVRLADAHGRRMFESGRGSVLVDWLEAVPQGAVGATGAAATHVLRLAAAHTMVGNTRRAAQLLTDVELEQYTAGERLVAEALRATRIYIDGAPGPTLAAAARALDGVDRIDPAEVPYVLGLTSVPMIEQMTRVSQAKAHWLLGDVEQAEAELTELLTGAGVSYPVWRIHALGSLALLEAWAGRLTSALEHARFALRTAKVLGLTRHVAVAHANLAAGHVMLERSSSARIGELFEDALAVTVPLRRPLTKTLYAVERASWCLALAEPEKALALLHREQRGGERPPPPIVADRMRVVEARAHLDAGRLSRAEAVLAGVEGQPPPALAPVMVRLALERGDLDDARSVLAAWVPPVGDVRNQLEHGLWCANVDIEGGQRARGQRTAQHVVASAQIEGHSRLFLDAGRYGTRLLHSQRDDSPARQRPALAVAAASGPGLSPREVEVLRYLCTPMSNAEIAAHLFISVNTLKTHLRAVYRKLDVPGRPEAAARAKELGLA